MQTCTRTCTCMSSQLVNSYRGKVLYTCTCMFSKPTTHSRALSGRVCLPLPQTLCGPKITCTCSFTVHGTTTHVHVDMINQTSRRLNKAKQIKSTCPTKSFFQRKIGCLRWDLNPRYVLCSLERVLCQFSHRGSSVDMGRISYTNTKQGKANHLNLINR